MTDPIYVAQTFEAETLADPRRSSEWLRACAVDAHEKGATWARATVDDERGGLIYEAWAKRPKDQGAPRWALSSETDTR